jgi:hypothetical protein
MSARKLLWILALGAAVLGTVANAQETRSLTVLNALEAQTNRGVQALISPVESNPAGGDICQFASAVANTQEEAEAKVQKKITNAFAKAIGGVRVGPVVEKHKVDEFLSRHLGRANEGSQSVTLEYSGEYISGDMTLEGLAFSQQSISQGSFMDPNGRFVTGAQATALGCMSVFDFRRHQFNNEYKKLREKQSVAERPDTFQAKASALADLETGLRLASWAFREEPFAGILRNFKTRLVDPLRRYVSQDDRINNSRIKLCVTAAPGQVLIIKDVAEEWSGHRVDVIPLYTTALSTNLVSGKDYPILGDLLQALHTALPRVPGHILRQENPLSRCDLSIRLTARPPAANALSALWRAAVDAAQESRGPGHARLRLRHGALPLFAYPAGDGAMPGNYLSFGDKLAVEDRRGSFYKVRFLDGSSGWFDRDSLDEAPRDRKPQTPDGPAAVTLASSFPGGSPDLVELTVSRLSGIAGALGRGLGVPVFTTQSEPPAAPQDAQEAVPGPPQVAEPPPPSAAELPQPDPPLYAQKARINASVLLSDPRLGAFRLPKGAMVLIVRRQDDGILVIEPRTRKTAVLSAQLLRTSGPLKEALSAEALRGFSFKNHRGQPIFVQPRERIRVLTATGRQVLILTDFQRSTGMVRKDFLRFLQD